MSENINKNGKACQPASAHAAMVEEVPEAMKRLRICPRKVLASLSYLRIDGARLIKPIESQAPRAGGKADVEAAILTSPQPSSSSEAEVPEYVAVKKLRFDSETDDDQALAPFAHEVGLLNDLSHDNVVKIIGFVEDVDNGVAWMVFAWEKNGNLREFVRAEGWELPERVSLIADVAEGLNYLHGRNPPICHGDLKSLNILVNSENRVIITDFGSARSMDSATEGVVSRVNVTKATKIQHQTSTEVTNMEPLKAEIAESGEFITMTGPAWTVRWAAPELLDGVLPGLASDVWAFGWICWEVVTGNFPFHEENDVAVVRRILTKDLPTVSNNAQLNQVKMLCSLMEECLRLDAAERPPAIRCRQVISWMDQAIPLRRDQSDSLATARSSRLLHALGRMQLQNGAIDNAQEYFRQSLDVSESVGDEQGKARAMYAIGGAYSLQGDYSKAREWYWKSRWICSNIWDELGSAQLGKALVAVHRIQGYYPKAEESYIQSIDLYSKIGYRPHVAEKVFRLGDGYYTAADGSRVAFRLPTVKDELDSADRLYALAEEWWGMFSDYSEAEELYKQSRDLYSQVGDQFGVARSANGLGNVYVARDEYLKAEESYIQSRDLCSKIGDQLGFAHSVKALGDLYRMQNEYFKARESYIQFRDLCSTIGDQLGFAHSVKALGDVYRMQDEYLKAEELYIQSRDLCSKIGDQLGLAHSAKSLADVYRKQNEYSKAETSYMQSRDLYSTIGNQVGFANSVKALMEVQCILEEYRKAEGTYIESMTSRLKSRINSLLPARSMRSHATNLV